MPKFRGFISVDIPFSQKINEFSNHIKNCGTHVKLVEPENIHITLKFLGETDEDLIEKIEESIKQSTRDTSSFEIKLVGTGVFPNPGYIKVIWIGVEDNGELKKIANNIDEQLSKLGFEREKRPFSPHLTIARVKSAKNKKKLLETINKYHGTVFTKINVESIKLKKSELTSEGPIYTTIREIKL